MLNTLGLGRSVPVSRGELIEIGGSFRLPDIIERSGCSIREVGTTNRTHLRDFERAIDATSAMLLKVHPSNYRIVGFTSDVEAPELAALARARDLPLVVDLGSGALIDLERFGLPHEPTVRETLAEGADLVTFSGDKLLGSVQAGLIVGRRDLIERLNRNPLKRALRCDKITLAILHYTLRLYQNPERLADELPLLATLTRPLAHLTSVAQRVATVIARAAPAEPFDRNDLQRMSDRQRRVAGEDASERGRVDYGTVRSRRHGACRPVAATRHAGHRPRAERRSVVGRTRDRRRRRAVHRPRWTLKDDRHARGPRRSRQNQPGRGANGR